MKVFTINPGSTSTKIALFQDNLCVFTKNVTHDAKELARFETLAEQLPYREETIINLLEADNVSLKGCDAIVGRGGGLVAMEGGTYEIDDLLLNHARTCANGVIHPASLGPQLARAFAERFGGRAFVVNPPDVDELQDVARVTGVKGIYRTVHLHALNLKETAIRHAQAMGKQYEDCDFIVCHIGGGISVSAHHNGRMIDGFDIVGGEGPMTPTRCGALSVSDALKYLENHGKDELRALCTKNGGYVSLMGTSDALDVSLRAHAGEREAELAWDGMLYQIQKSIGAMAAVLQGHVDGILIGGGMARDKDLEKKIRAACEWIAPISMYPGEFEMEAMVAGATRVLQGQESAKQYTGKPRWSIEAAKGQATHES